MYQQNFYRKKDQKFNKRGSYNKSIQNNYNNINFKREENYYNNIYLNYYYPPKYDSKKIIDINEYYIQREILYHTEDYIISKYPNLLYINERNAKLNEKINENSKFFIIKSYTEEDIHKSIKYGIWCSSKEGNLILNDAFNEVKEKKGNIYLFFSSFGTERFVGLAEMKTLCDKNKIFDLWTQDGKWIGLFEVEWLYIKDIPFEEFKEINIIMKNGEIKNICEAKDIQEIPYEKGKSMIEIIDKYQNSNTILEHFEFYDVRQESYELNTKKK